MGDGDDVVGDAGTRPQLAMADLTSIASFTSSSSSLFGSSIGAGVKGLEGAAADLPQFAIAERTSIGVEGSCSSAGRGMAREAVV